MLQKIKGYKKITAAAIGLIAAILGTDYIGLEPQAIGNIVELLGFYLIGQGAADLGEHINKKQIINAEN